MMVTGCLLPHWQSGLFIAVTPQSSMGNVSYSSTVLHVVCGFLLHRVTVSEPCWAPAAPVLRSPQPYAPPTCMVHQYTRYTRSLCYTYTYTAWPLWHMQSLHVQNSAVAALWAWRPCDLECRACFSLHIVQWLLQVVLLVRDRQISLGGVWHLPGWSCSCSPL